MPAGRARRNGRARTLLPLRASHLSDSLSCWYCDLKIHIFNGPLFSFGHRYARFLRVWFMMGVAFCFMALPGVVMLLVWESAGALHLHSGIFGLHNLSVSWLFGSSTLVSGLGMSIMDAGIMVSSTVISVAIHEFGHAIAAACEGIQIEYIAIFLAVIFPGALVAFNNDLLQSLSHFSALRIYCAGIWHNAVFCAACGLTLFLLPLILHPLYIHGEKLMVVGVPQISALSGYLSPGDIILSVDGSKITYPDEWVNKLVQINAGMLHKAESGWKGYCVPNSWAEGIKGTHSLDDQFSCPDELAAFLSMSCHISTLSDVNKRENKYCLTAKDVVKLKKCGDGWQMTGADINSCACSEGESCMTPVLGLGTSWVEISYSSPYSSECLQLKRNISTDSENHGYGSASCGGTFVYIGDPLTLAYSVQLSAYQPRYSYLSAYIPTILQKFLNSIFHVSGTLGFLNSLPVFFLDGESILETGLCFFISLNPRRRRRVLRFCLTGGCILSIIAFSRILSFA